MLSDLPYWDEINIGALIVGVIVFATVIWYLFKKISVIESEYRKSIELQTKAHLTSVEKLTQSHMSSIEKMTEAHRKSIEELSELRIETLIVQNEKYVTIITQQIKTNTKLNDTIETLVDAIKTGLSNNNNTTVISNDKR